MKKICYIISDIDKALAFEWIASDLVKYYRLSFVLIGQEKTELAAYLRRNNIEYNVVSTQNGSSRFRQWWLVFKILRHTKPDIVHMHLWRAMLLGLTASFLAGVKHRVFTRHHATIHYTMYPSGKKWDRLCNTLATRIVAISANIKEILVGWEHVRPEKVDVIHHGFDLEYFRMVPPERVTNLKAKLQISAHDHPVVGVIARYTEWKGIQYIVPAFRELLQRFPNALLVLANAQGEYTSQIKALLHELPAERYREVIFENDLAALYKLFDIYVHAPVDGYAEAFGQTYIESLTAGIPGVFTLSGVGKEILTHEKNALVVPFMDSRSIATEMLRLVINADLRSSLVKNGMETVRPFSLPLFLNKLRALYDSMN
jgi:glycosyltransferase involved in cell wall biosynthesis